MPYHLLSKYQILKLLRFGFPKICSYYLIAQGNQEVSNMSHTEELLA